MFASTALQRCCRLGVEVRRLPCRRQCKFKPEQHRDISFSPVVWSLQVTPLTYTDVLEYLYYGGMIWARVNALDRACEFFELVSLR